MKIMRHKSLKQLFFFNLLLVVLYPTILSAQTDSLSLSKLLTQQPEIKSVTPISNNIFPEKYVVKVSQEVDWGNASAGQYEERVIVCFRGYDLPTVLVTEGYFASYALSPYYDEELSTMFYANLIVCEYRYFGESVPKECNWDYLTVDNSLKDLHHVREIFGRIFQGKWISTGISKGGQTTMFYRATYPEDVDVSVSYVAPLNKGVEDGRHEPFLNKKVGESSDRLKIQKAQEELLSRKSRLLPRFEAYCKSANLQFQDSYSTIYDYCIFEFPFAFWQWGTSVTTIPSHDSTDEEWFSYFMKISEPNYFSCPSEFTPFFVQAARELGYYGYSRKGLTNLCDVKNTHGYLRRLMLPNELQDIKFDKSLYKRTVKYLKRNDPRHIFIYGEVDPWSASGVAPWLDCSKKKNMKIFIQPNGSHKARIGNMPDKMREEIVDILTKWLTE